MRFILLLISTFIGSLGIAILIQHSSYHSRLLEKAKIEDAKTAAEREKLLDPDGNVIIPVQADPNLAVFERLKSSIRRETEVRYAADSEAWSDVPIPAQIEANLNRLKKTRKCIGCDLRGADMSDMDLNRANLAGADLTGADLSKARLINTTLKEANLTQAKLFKAVLQGANLQNANLTDANLYQAEMLNISLENALLKGANLADSELRDSNIKRGNLTGADAQDASFYGSVMIDAKLFETNFDSADLRYANFSGVDLSRTNLNNANLLYSILPEEAGYHGITPY